MQVLGRNFGRQTPTVKVACRQPSSRNPHADRMPRTRHFNEALNTRLHVRKRRSDREHGERVVQVRPYRGSLVGSSSTTPSAQDRGELGGRATATPTGYRIPMKADSVQKVSGSWRGLHSASKLPNDALFLVSASFGPNAGMWPALSAPLIESLTAACIPFACDPTTARNANAAGVRTVNSHRIPNPTGQRRKSQPKRNRTPSSGRLAGSASRAVGDPVVTQEVRAGCRVEVAHGDTANRIEPDNAVAAARSQEQSSCTSRGTNSRLCTLHTSRSFVCDPSRWSIVRPNAFLRSTFLVRDRGAELLSAAARNKYAAVPSSR